jgi:hypothetical protein
VLAKPLRPRSCRCKNRRRQDAQPPRTCEMTEDRSTAHVNHPVPLLNASWPSSKKLTESTMHLRLLCTTCFRIRKSTAYYTQWWDEDHPLRMRRDEH